VLPGAHDSARQSAYISLSTLLYTVYYSAYFAVELSQTYVGTQEEQRDLTIPQLSLAYLTITLCGSFVKAGRM
jgi:hypothetical protein